jgi:Flp pilus assembly protein CpaB
LKGFTVKKTTLALNVSLLIVGMYVLAIGGRLPTNNIVVFFGKFIIVYAVVYLFIEYRGALGRRWRRTQLYTRFASKTPAQQKRTIAFWLIAQVLLVILLWTGAALQVMAMRFDPPRRPVPVAVAAADLPAQTRLTAKQVETFELAEYGLPPNCLGSSTHVVGARLKVDVSRGQPLTADLITREIEPFLPPGGMRAFTLSLSRDDASIGFLRPGSIVDVHVTFSLDDAEIGESLVIAPLLQQLRVLAIDSRRASSPNVTVTLEVNDKQAGVLQLARRGSLALVLRNPMDTKFYPVQPMVLRHGRFEPFGEPLDPQDPAGDLNDVM